MAIDFSGYASNYAGSQGQAGQQIGAGISRAISSIPTREERFENAKTEWFNDKFDGLGGEWLTDANGTMKFQTKTINPNYDPMDPNSSMYNTGAWSPGNQTEAYKDYMQFMIDKFGKRKVDKFGLADPIEFANKYKDLQSIEARQIATKLKELKYTMGDDWDNDAVYSQLTSVENKQLYDFLNQQGLMTMDPDLAEIQPDARISDYLTNPFSQWWDAASSGKVKDLPLAVGAPLAAGLGYKFIKGQFYNASGKRIPISEVFKKGKGMKIGAGLAIYLGIPWAAEFTAEQLGSKNPEWWGTMADRGLGVGVGALTASKIASVYSPAYRKQVLNMLNKLPLKSNIKRVSGSGFKFKPNKVLDSLTKGLTGSTKFTKKPPKLPGKLGMAIQLAWGASSLLGMAGDAGLFGDDE